MDSFNTSNISQSVINQLNFGLSSSSKANLDIQRGEKHIKPEQDLGGFSQKQILLNDIKNNRSNIRNFQNALSFSQAQQGALSNVHSIISRIMELKTNFEGIISNAEEKVSYDEEFKELQMQIKNIREMKFNGVSLFSHSGNQQVVQKSSDPNSLLSDNSNSLDSPSIDRAGLFGALKVTRNFASDSDVINATGGPEEYRLNKTLKSPSGELTWWQWAYTATDNFQAFHGNEKIHDKSYGSSTIGLNNGRVLIPEPGSSNGGARGFPNSAWLNDPARYDKNKDVIEFGRNGNPSTSLEFLVNESGQNSGTGWHMEYKIDYDPITIDLMDDSKVYSLSEVDISELQSMEDNITHSIGENASTQQRLSNEISNLESKLTRQSYQLESHSGVDIAKTMSTLTIANTKLNLNARLIKSAQQMENKLFTDFL